MTEEGKKCDFVIIRGQLFYNKKIMIIIIIKLPRDCAKTEV